MAQLAKTNELTDNLIRATTSLKKDDEGYKAAKIAASRGLRDQSHARTNQFDIRARLNGLVEKFAVLDRDDLSDALQDRLDELPSEGKWLPEILSLLLELSDRPVNKTPPDALEALRAADNPVEALTWHDIFGSGEADDSEKWQNIEHGYHSSEDDEVLLEDESEHTTSTQATSVDNEDTETTAARCYVLQPDLAALKLVGRSLPKDGTSMSELHVVRESISMLRGLATSLYHINADTGEVQTDRRAVLATASAMSVQHSMQDLATLGSALAALRQWTKSEQTQPYLRTAQASCHRLLKSLGDQLSDIEKSYTLASANTVVSVIDLNAKVEGIARPLLEMSRLATPLKGDLDRSPFAPLDALYEQACAAQLAGDGELLAATSTVLFDSVQTYLRPVAEWMAQGRIPTAEDNFLVANSDSSCESGDLWHNRTALKTTANGQPSTPGFLQGFASSIFALGKSRMFLVQLNGDYLDLSSSITANEVGPDFSTIRQAMGKHMLVPFSELFDESMREWIATGTNAAPTLQKSLMYDHGLLAMCNALDHIYFSANGADFQDFAESLFYRIERQKGRLPNAFLLTELAKASFGSAPVVDADALSITVDAMPAAHSTMELFQKIHLKYELSWPVRNITRERSPHTHSLAFSLLLQTFFAHTILSTSVFDIRQMPATREDRAADRLLRLRYRLLAFSNALLTHVTTVGRVLGTDLREQMIAARDIDAMVAVYSAYKYRLDTALLLGKSLKPVRDAAITVLGLAEKFSYIWNTVISSAHGENAGADAGTIEMLGRSLDEPLAFMAAGVRGVSRSGGEVLLGTLAEHLEWMVP